MNKMNTIWDTPSRYGLISRALHWLMAVLFLWQFMSAILRVVAKDTTIYNIFWSAHHQLGFVLLVLVLLRGTWGVLNFGRRPHKSGHVGKLATLGHLVIYGLMFAVPALALLRTYGSGRGFSFLGVRIFEQTGVQNAALTAPGNVLHGLLGWVLLAAVFGHVLMALFHHFALRDDTLRYMTGRKVLN
ncbi:MULTISPECIES: cytochrome b [Brucella/Ochrobactrum group]|uniref:cytochrome b n=1 Tax=Brucella/Ochrobactrum group TaxID=2826938 RepID=UPI000D706EF8|nr:MULTISPECIES: cytochrome b [Brucella/Ochrobactrum group]MCH4543570.1 cytochrome b [Ochrobactrum sp. A-1]PWU75742.1 cytochrome B [Ochrobactrum sp. POC9]